MNSDLVRNPEEEGCLAGSPALEPWLAELAVAQPSLSDLLRRPVAEQYSGGYFHTLREICQQPLTWTETANRMLHCAPVLEAVLSNCQAVVLTGSGSSQYAGDCLQPALQDELQVPVQAVGGGSLLLHGRRAIPPCRPALLVSLARSGDSPESAGALDLLLGTEPHIRHLIITCNANGRLATCHCDHPRVRVISLDNRINDRSLVMTSSFTNMVLAGRVLGMLSALADYRAMVAGLARVGRSLLVEHAGTLADLARSNFRRAVFLGSGSRFGAAREAALKMLEMTAGGVVTMAETCLGLRHGPMSALHDDTLVVCFLSSSAPARFYELDLIEELNAKGLGARKIIFGERVPRELALSGDAVLECPGLAELGDDNVPVLDVMVGQLLAFFRCRAQGLSPDSPSRNGVISRVVDAFRLHREMGPERGEP